MGTFFCHQNDPYKMRTGSDVRAAHSIQTKSENSHQG